MQTDPVKPVHPRGAHRAILSVWEPPALQPIASAHAAIRKAIVSRSARRPRVRKPVAHFEVTARGVHSPNALERAA